MYKYLYSLYDSKECPVLITPKLQDISNYLGRSSFNSMCVTVCKYFKKISCGKSPYLEDTAGNKYTLYRDKE